MEELISTIAAVIGAFLCIAAGAWYVSAQPLETPESVASKLNASLPAQTIRSHDWHVAPDKDRSFMVEMVR
jgi:acyl-CoA synthetase (AMP-forming)/AMP-acid ligase II